MPLIRAFIAIESNAAVLEALDRLQAALRTGPGSRAARWANPEIAHLTCKFLGDVPADEIASIGDALDAVCALHAPFALQLQGLGCFPSRRRPRVVWAGIAEPQGHLLALQRHVEAAMAEIGYRPEVRPFSPHLTLARVRDGALSAEVEALARSVANHQAEAAQPMAQLPVTELTIFRSELRPEGPIYTALHRAPLRG